MQVRNSVPDTFTLSGDYQNRCRAGAAACSASGPDRAEYGRAADAGRTDRAGIRFNLINPDTRNRIRMITQDAETGQELERRNLVKGYEFRKNRKINTFC
jgi:hypothetical protein